MGAQKSMFGLRKQELIKSPKEVGAKKKQVQVFKKKGTVNSLSK